MERTFKYQSDPIHWQPINRETFLVPFTRTLGAVFLSSGATMDTRTINLVAGHGVVVGNDLFITENKISYLGAVTNVNGNVITLDTPLNIDFSTGATLLRLTSKLNVDGSSTPQYFEIAAPGSNIWAITKFIVVMYLGSQPDHGLFGDIAALTNGTVLRLVNGHIINKANFKTNGELAAICGGIAYSTRSGGQGSYGLHAVYEIANQGNGGNAYVLDGNKEEKLQIIVQDNLLNLNYFHVFGIGMVDN